MAAHSGGPRLGAAAEKAKDFKGTMRRLIKYLRGYIPAFAAVAVFAGAATVFTIFAPMILGMVTTELFEGAAEMIAGTGGIDFSEVARILGFLAAVYLASALFNFAQGFIMTKISTKISYSMRRDIIHKVNKLPLSFFDRITHGEVLSRITNDVDTVTQTMSSSMTQIVASVTQFTGVLLMMFFISPLMTLVALCIIPASLLIIKKLVKYSQPLFKKQQEYLGKVNGHVEEMYGGHMIITAFNREKHSIEDFDRLNDELYSASWKSQFISGMMMPLMNFVGNLGYVGICVLGGMLSFRGVITVGEIQAFIHYVRHFTHPIQQLADMSNVLQQTAAAAERVFEFLEEKEEAPDAENALSAENIMGEVVFDDVSFGYTPEKTVIHNFSASVKPGQRVAVVGPTGAGKTTIVKLLMRFYEVSSGEIRLDGININDFKRNELRSQFGMVLQDTWLYNASISDNIRFGSPSADDSAVFSAAEAAQVNHFVHTLPQGYDTVLDEDAANISQGQKQLLTIARTIVSDPKILILDEATSSVDTRTELMIQRAMDKLTEGRTSFIIAHRLSTIRNADLILVMNNGDIVESGTHMQLLEKNGFYSELYKSQFAPVE